MDPTFIFTFTTQCGDCGKKHGMAANSGDFAAWRNGELIQFAMPYLTANQRELLVSGICGPCFDSVYA